MSRATLHLRLVVAGLAAVALVVGGSQAAPAAGIVVGKVVAVGGTGGLKAKDDSSGATRRLRVGDTLVAGQQVVMGKGVTATLRLVRPASVSADDDLVLLQPAPGAHSLIAARREGGATIVEITPAP